MSVFLLASFPLYLCFLRGSTPLQVLRSAFWGLVTFIPVYIISRNIPNPGFFLWSILQVFVDQIWRSREASFRIFATLVWGIPILWHKLLGKKHEHHDFLCWLSGYFFALNFHDFLLLGPFPSAKELFFGPLSRILFAHLLSEALSCFAGYEHGFRRLPAFVSFLEHEKVFGWFLLFVAFFVLNLVSSLVIILNAYWSGSLVFLLTLCFLCFHGRTLPENGNLQGQK